jgi:hypothetical protein
LENDENNEKKLYLLIEALLKDEWSFEKALNKMIATILKKCKRERRKKNSEYRKTPRERMKKLA